MEHKNVRIKDIAIRAKVSTGTVDRVIHDRGRVSKKVKERVLKIIQELDYQPNLLARVLGNNKTFRIASLVPDPLHDPYWGAPQTGIREAQKELKHAGVEVRQYLFNSYEVSTFIEQAEKVTADAPDGILVSPLFYREAMPFLNLWKEQQIPFVLFNTSIADVEPLSYIGQDLYHSGMLAARLAHFVSPTPGTVIIAHIDEDISNAAHLIDKEKGFRNYFVQNNLDMYTIVKVELDRSTAAGFKKSLDKLIEDTPDLLAIFVTTSKAFHIAKYLEQRFIKHIKIIGYDLLQQNLYYLNTGTISFLINQNPKGQGYLGIIHLADHLVFKKSVPEVRYLPLDIVVKENASYYAG